MNFIVLDLILLGLFLLFVAQFLIRNKKNVKKDGLMLLYRTKWGLNLIEKTGKKYPKLFRFLSYLAVGLGYFLMIAIVYLFFRILYIYVLNPEIVRAVKIPPITPLIPYLPQIFKLDFLPNFYFAHWILILAFVAITHEFFHGIFASHADVKTKKTGFGFFPFFLPVFLAAFVELDEEKMEKVSNFKQRAVLAAGTFANVLGALIGVILMFVFFSLSFSASGVVYDDYAYNFVSVDSIQSIDGVDFDSNNFNYSQIQVERGLKNIVAEGQTYSHFKSYLPEQGYFLAYYDSPAISNNLTGIIQEINGQKITSMETLSLELDKYSFGEEITIKTYEGNEEKIQTIELGENPHTGEAWLGISFYDKSPKGAIAKFSSFFTSYKKPNVYYEAKYEFAKYIYDLLWWLILICFSVALVNMLPMGIFDGGRFFYLTVLAITKNKKKAEFSFKRITQFFLFLLLVIMVFWAKSFI